MEEKLTAILERIETSTLTDDEKVKLYALISESLKASIWPTLLAAMPKDKLEAFTKTEPGKASIEAYLSLIEDATTDEKNLDAINSGMEKLLDEIDAVLQEEHI